ncbi:hypothetical protein V5738_02445 [Salinisphaera sp. SPP-AMP-43]|uniref:hypothetical protein n=1 Tax=Salinisphaera sp. SPP-AMP-43 TaxID=3121288 RepID=UPI003C6E4033
MQKDRGGNPLFHDLNTDYPARLAAAAVELVSMAHLHTDYVGWNTVREGDIWRPMFPNADYVCSAAERVVWQAEPAKATILADSMQPMLGAGLLRTIDPAAGPVFDDVFTDHATPGHSFDHGSIALISDGQYALFGGDVRHHPIQAGHAH